MAAILSTKNRGNNRSLMIAYRQWVTTVGKFHRSAGLSEMDCVPVKKAAESRNHQFGGAQVYKEHPYVSLRKLTCSVSNPRIGPYPSPIGMEALVRIKVAFASNPVWSSKSGSLVVIGNDGIMTEYTLSISPSPTAASSTTSAATQPRPNPDEAMIQCTLTPGAQWTLQRFFNTLLLHHRHWASTAPEIFGFRHFSS
ncbi:unnamed protein product [Gongylonema pulchrum]|uniref:Uncharacterized protein n=1 Tax=Gongylonema pulchrum TaxID=637853 RepID=A0A183EVM7_9BILA|nr:unnamed protein product [Gongylonema pulchrum]